MKVKMQIGCPAAPRPEKSSHDKINYDLDTCGSASHPPSNNTLILSAADRERRRGIHRLTHIHRLTVGDRHSTDKYALRDACMETRTEADIETDIGTYMQTKH